jgi:hypothetical protein
MRICFTGTDLADISAVYEGNMKFSRIAKLSQPFVFTISALSLSGCSDEADPQIITNPPPPDGGSEVSTKCPEGTPSNGTSCEVPEQVTCRLYNNCNIEGAAHCVNNQWVVSLSTCNPPPPPSPDARTDASTDAMTSDAATADSASDAK